MNPPARSPAPPVLPSAPDRGPAEGDAGIAVASRGPGRPPIDRRELEPVLDAVLRLSALKSSRDITLREIAAEAGVSVGRLQHHFGTRDQLIGRAFERYLLRVTSRLDDMGRSTGTATERMARLVDEIAVTHLWQRSSVWIDLLGRSSDSEHYRQIAVGVNDAWFAVLVRLVRDGVASGEFTIEATAEQVAWAIIGAADGLTTLVVVEGAAQTAARAPWRRRQLAMTVEALLGAPLGTPAAAAL